MEGCLGAFLIILLVFAILYLAFDMFIWAVCTVFGLVFTHWLAFAILIILAIVAIFKKVIK